MKDPIIIANCGGFWGDDPTAARRQVEGGPIDYLVMDYLAEVTMAILQKQRLKNPEAGFATDFLTQLRDVLPTCVAGGIKVISNAGGVNPLACRAAVEALAQELGISDKVKVGVVLGDDIFSDLNELTQNGEPFLHMETDRPLQDVRSEVLSANVYLGADPVVQALKMGANVVISGRVTDTAVTLAPMIHEFGWSSTDWDRLASGIVAGHIIECGTQCTGGNFTDWQKVPSFKNMGYPLIKASPDGTFVVSKHPQTGGMVTVHTITEQLLYEMGSPIYIAPDCTARFDSIQLSQKGPDEVQVTGIRGGPPPEKLKVSLSFNQGYRAFGRLMISGPDVLEKSKTVAKAFWESVGGEESYEHAVTQQVGWDSCHPSLTQVEPGELLLQVAVRDSDKNKINNLFAPQLVPKVLSTVPGITYLGDQGRPRASGVVGYWPALISRTGVQIRVVAGDETVLLPNLTPPFEPGKPFSSQSDLPPVPTSGKRVKVPLSRLCLARSGDKGDTCNIGVIARSKEVHTWITENLTAEFVKARFAGVCQGKVERFEVPNLMSLNFLLHQSLGGGGTLSLLLDAQGKTYAQYLLASEVEVDEALAATVGLSA